MESAQEIFHTKAVGVTFEDRQYTLQNLERLGTTEKEKVKITLRREPQNQFDKNAVAIDITYFDSTFLQDTTNQVGYIRKEVAENLAYEMDAGTEFLVLDFQITGGYKKTRGINLTIIRKEGDMAKISPMDVLKQSGGGKKADFDEFVLKMKPNSMLTVRFLKPLSQAIIQATHNFDMPAGWPKKKEWFECLKYVAGDDTVDCPADKVNEPWIKLILPVIDRTDGKVKLFRETQAVYKYFVAMEETAQNDAEKTIKIGGLTNADIQLVQMGAGKDRKVTAFPVAATIRPLTVEEKALPIPDHKPLMRILTREEIQKIVDYYVGHAQTSEQTEANMNVQPSGPFAAQN